LTYNDLIIDGTLIGNTISVVIFILSEVHFLLDI